MGAANVYLGLKAGMTVSASIPAAVIAMVILRGLFKNGSILEANQVQTAASAGESLAAGIIFTMPAMILIGFWDRFDFWTTTLIAFTGGLLGILFMIPMRKVFVVNAKKELKYPEGIACAAVLRAGDDGEGKSKGARRIVQGALLGALAKFSIGFMGIFSGALEAATRVGGRVFFIGGDVSPALVSVGFIVGLNVSFLIFLGGSLAWLIQIPVISNGFTEMPALDAAWTLWSTKVRYTGVGAMVVGGVVSIYKVRHGLVEAVRELKKTAQRDNTGDDSQRDIPSFAIIGLSILATLLVAGIYYTMTQSVMVTVLTTVIMIVMSFFFTAVASYIVGLVGNSNSPVSGMTITAVLFTGGLILLFGFSGMQGMAATLGVAAIVCCAACTSGDVCNDLKTGALVGATPYKQQIMQVSGVAVAALVMAPILQLLHDYTPGGIGGRELAAPQAALFASLVKGFFGEGSIPWDYVGVGVAIGIGLWLADLYLEAKDANLRLHLMPVAVGMYLPFGLAIPIFIGGILVYFLTKEAPSDDEKEKLARNGVLFSSGVIAGESLMGVGLALLASVGLTKLNLGLDQSLVHWLSLGLCFVTVFMFRKLSRA
jgi:putative OPT family oligopeptide transporter